MTKSNRKRVALIDSNSLIHRAFHALPPLTAPDGRPTGAVYGYVMMLLNVIKDVKPDYIVAVWDTKEPTFRHKEYLEYKAQRPTTDPLLIEQIPITQEVVRSLGIPQLSKEGFEADDIIGTLANSISKDKDMEVVIVTGDMDALQLVRENVFVYTAKRGLSNTVLYDEEKVKERYGGLSPNQLVDYKALRGDPSDNIPGVKGIGDKTATELLLRYGDLDKIYAHIDEIQGRTGKLLVEGHESAFLSRKLARIDVDVPIDFRLEDAVITDFDIDRAIEVFTSLGFKSMIGKLLQLKNGDLSVSQPKRISPGDDIKKILPLEEKEWEGVSKKDWHVFDYKIVENVLTGYTGKRLSFEKVFERWFGFELAPVETFSVEEKQLLEYALAFKMKKELAGEKLERQRDLIYNCEFVLVPILERMKEVGIAVDRSFLAEEANKFEARLKDLQRKIYESVGYEFNINSPKQLAEVLFDVLKLPVIKKTKTSRSTDESVLTKLSGLHPVVDLLLQYRSEYKIKSTYLEPLLEFSQKDGRIHSTFKLAATASGRLSSNHPNLQNIPINDELGFRRVFIASSGKVLVAADYSQIELRLMASMSGDEQLLELFASGVDVHLATAARLFKKDIKEISSAERKIGKTVNFSIMYGISPFGLAEALGIDRAEAKRYISDYYETYPDVKRWQEEVLEKTRKLGFVESMYGRRRLLPDINSTNVHRRMAAERVAINHPLQGTQADIIKKAMVSLDKQMHDKKMPADLLLQIHDELVLEVQEYRAYELARLLRDVMEDVVELQPKLKVEVKIGPNWLDTQTVT